MMRGHTPLPSRAENALETLQPAIERTDEGLTRARARAVLASDEFSAAETDDLIEVLLQRGYLYAVHDLLRVTE